MLFNIVIISPLPPPDGGNCTFSLKRKLIRRRRFPPLAGDIKFLTLNVFVVNADTGENFRAGVIECTSQEVLQFDASRFEFDWISESSFTVFIGGLVTARNGAL